MDPRPSFSPNGSAAGHTWAMCLLTMMLLHIAQPRAHPQTFHSFLGAENGRIYTITTSGSLVFYWHDPEDGNFSWRHGGVGQSIGGAGWVGFEHTLYNGEGIIYAIDVDGKLLHYRDLARDGTASWAHGGVGVEVGLGRGWADYVWALGGGNGILYVIDRAGGLFFYQHLTQDENAVWANGGNAQQIGSGWNTYKRVFSGHNGVIYGIGHDGTLFYNRDLARNGTANWEFGAAGLAIGSGWDQFHHVFSTGNGNLYAVRENGDLLFYRVTVAGAVPVWGISGARIGFGFVPELWKGGYCWPLSASPGEEIAFNVSGTGRFDVRYYRHKSNASGLNSIPMGTTDCLARVQPVLDDVGRYGCGWTTSFALRVPSDWPSGIYSAYCSNAVDQFYITFIVKPDPTRPSGLAVLANVNTWLAYNGYSGTSKYGGRAHLSFLQPHPNTSPVWNGRDQEMHLTVAELWILGWLEDEGYSPDIYTDIDFHNGIPLEAYPCLIVGTHPEYWSVRMYHNLQSYLTRGGSLLYLGGNGIYEVADYIDDQTGMVFLAGVEKGARADALFRRLDPPLPERALLGVATEHCGATAAPYQAVRAEHPFFIGTGLVDSMSFGHMGLNPRWPAACGLEVDSAAGPGAVSIPYVCATEEFPVPVGPGLPPRLMILATELDPDYEQGADMIYYPHAGGGFVFSVGSITYGASLALDPAIQQITRNALAEAFVKTPRLSITLLSAATGQISLRGRFGASYALQASQDLRAGSWADATTVILNDELTKTLNISLTGSQRFYRAVLRP